MFQYIVRRILISMPVLLGVTIICFLIINLAPGDPVDMMMDPNTPKEIQEATREKLGLNQPIYIRYFQWLMNLKDGNFGYSYKTYQPVKDMIAQRILPTIQLMGVSLLAGLMIALPLGVLSAVKQYSWIDYISTTFSFLGISVPSFFFGLLAIYIFSLKLGWLPSSGTVSLGSEKTLIDSIRHMALPVTVLSLSTAGQFIRYVRSSVLEVLGKDYLRTARAKGLSEAFVIGKHSFRNAVIPIITMLGLEIPGLFGGAIITEQLFSWPGIGQLAVGAISGRDYPVLMAVNFITAFLVLASGLLTDVLYSVFDPRIKY
ncbi:MAG: ABC transporter permease [Lachnospiraceae bacterium]|nr:ABC transporter permease [Lachnospiraceae bacterium]